MAFLKCCSLDIQRTPVQKERSKQNLGLNREWGGGGGESIGVGEKALIV